MIGCKLRKWPNLTLSLVALIPSILRDNVDPYAPFFLFVIITRPTES